MHVALSPDVTKALEARQPVVALESTVIAHGLPWPQNLELAQELEQIVRDHNAVPATIAIIEGQPRAGLSTDELTALADGQTPVEKISRRDVGVAITRKLYGATTVAATMIIAAKVGIQVFATGGIGGVHRGDTGDISADLPELSQTPVVVVCAGAKSILDLPRTLEWLETAGVPLLGYQTDEFPAFYTPKSGLQIPCRVENPTEIAQIVQAQWRLGLQSGVLVTVPIRTEDALEADVVEGFITRALEEADADGIVGKEVTPFVLSRLVNISHGETLKANLALLRQNAAVAAQIATEMVKV
jgi:pseudouridylate synthase